MIRLFKVKEKQKETAENARENGLVKKQCAGELRLHRDISELNMPEECKISFPNGKDDLMDFEITITPYRGYYMGGGFVFTFKVPAVYPHEPPKVKCKTKIYHPNIDLEGNTCLNILREDWKPVLNINTVIYGLYHLFTVSLIITLNIFRDPKQIIPSFFARFYLDVYLLWTQILSFLMQEPNHEDPLNQEAADLLRDNPKLFGLNVRKSIEGNIWVGGAHFPGCKTGDFY
ncbi:NEDD8-conjugating enzyme Ubc12-like [Pyrus ussuriensis x Pyrus communis]|uniref:NEDD8 carrier protein n=1 Tax=Pyrus ussuriensis x Pyrus communis TaxID=2448454 RepID=A0A5N5HRC4_9ROSA|nr:NEDD8-conjugating enzyme Ubc12-like [Pyrus ussuriensis x Pyrus communis]